MIRGSRARYAWLRLARPRSWFLSKIPFAAAAGLVVVPEAPLARLLGMIAAVVAWGAFGFGLNEIADRHCDARAGKTNRAAGLTRTSRIGFLLFTGGAALWLSAISAADLAAPMLVLAGLGLAAAYSAPPLRMKERGFAGIVAAAVNSGLPVLAVAAVEPRGWLRPAALSFALLGLAIGVRSMGVHQRNDALKDRAAGVRTYASLGRPIVRLIYAAFATELVFLAGALVLAWPQSIDAAATLGVWVATAALFQNPVKGFRGRMLRHVDAPLAGYYYRAFPAVMLLSRTTPLSLWYRAGLAALFAHVLAATVRRRRAGRERPAAEPPHAVPPQPIHAALAFLTERQRSTGEFQVVVGRDPTLQDGIALRCVFETAFVARILEPWASDDRVALLLERARAFLRVEREPSGVWRYFGRDSIIPADADDTACALLILPPEPGDGAVIDAILSNCDPQGAVLTWFLDPAYGPPFRNCVDACVNVNVYTLLRRRSIAAPKIRRYLEEVLFSRRFLEGSPYYPSPFFYLYVMGGLTDELGPRVSAQIEREIRHLLSRGPAPSSLESAMACATLIRCGADDALRRPLLERVRSDQRADGGWPAVPLCWGMGRGRAWYGSRELTTAFCLEAIGTAVTGRSIPASCR